MDVTLLHPDPALVIWRHPRPHGAAGRCIGRTDLAVDRRKVKRLAHRIRQAARRAGWPRVIHTSSLQRCALVGRQLRRWGWRHIVDDALLEMDFGRWDGRPWTEIAHAEVDAWCAAFADHAPGGGESLRAMLERVQRWLPAPPAPSEGPVLMVGHGGWMLSARWVLTQVDAPVAAAAWPAPPGYGRCWTLARAPLQYRPVTPASQR